MDSLAAKLRLYAVTDRGWLATSPAGFDTLERQVEEALSGGVTMVQVREKNSDFDGFCAIARSVKRVTDRHGVPLIVNDSLDVALAVDAAGAHIGQGDEEARAARRRLGGGKILGVSVETVGQAQAAVSAGADYLGVGTIFATATKPEAAVVSLETLRGICAAVPVPVVAIGGISLANLPALAGSGVAGIAVVSAIFAQGAAIRQASMALRRGLSWLPGDVLPIWS